MSREEQLIWKRATISVRGFAERRANAETMKLEFTDSREKRPVRANESGTWLVYGPSLPCSGPALVESPDGRPLLPRNLNAPVPRGYEPFNHKKLFKRLMFRNAWAPGGWEHTEHRGIAEIGLPL